MLYVGYLCLRSRRPQCSNLTSKLVPYTTLCRSCAPAVADCSPLFVSPYKTGINTLGAGYARSWGHSLRVEYDAGPVVIKSISAYRELEGLDVIDQRSEEHTSELQSLMRISYAVL